MSIQKSVNDRRPAATQALNVCYMLDEQGREIQVTAAMVQGLCAQLLQRCKSSAKAA